MPDHPDTDDKDVRGFARPFHTHPHIEAERGHGIGHAHADGGKPHRHITKGSPEWLDDLARRLTSPRRKALRTILVAELAGRVCTESNVTTEPGSANQHGEATVYWQVRAWATRTGYAKVTMSRGRQHITLTEAGRALARRVNLQGVGPTGRHDQ